jgi:hypothetical protein
MTAEELLQKVDELLAKEGHNVSELTREEKLYDFVLPGLEKSKSTLSSLYKYEPRNKRGIFGAIKFKILSKLKNIIINVVERESMSQQKVNELTFQAFVLLTEEIKTLKEKSTKK